MTVHGAGPAVPFGEPVTRDIVLRRDGTSVTLAQAPGLPQLVYRSFAEAVQVANAFAAAHDVDVWCADGRRWSLVATHRSRGAAAAAPPAVTPAVTPTSPDDLRFAPASAAAIASLLPRL